MIAQLLLTSSLMLLQQAVPAVPGAADADQMGQQIALEAVRHQGGPAGMLAGVLVPVAFFALILAIVWLGFRRKQAQIQARSEFHKQLLDKFASGREFTEFLATGGGQKFLDQLWSPSVGAREKMLSTIRTGVVLAVFGLGLLGLSVAKRGLVVPAVLVLALGCGFLIATAVSYRITQRWGQNGGPGAGHPQLP